MKDQTGIPCMFCRDSEGFPNAKAILLAPQYVGGDESSFIQFLAVCKYHAEGWYKDVPDKRLHIPMIKLTQKFHNKHDCSISTAE